MIKEGIVEYEKAIALSDGNPFVTASLVCLYYQIGEKDQAEKLFDRVKKRAETEYVPATSFYLIYRYRGNEDLSLEWLKRACNEHDTFLPWLRANPVHFPKGSKYMALLKEMGLDY